jgi:hypothetical protein
MSTSQKWLSLLLVKNLKLVCEKFRPTRRQPVRYEMNTHAIAGTNVGGSMDRARTVSDIIDQRPLSGLQISTFLLCGLVLVLDGFDAQSLGFLAPSMARTFRVPVSSFGPIFGAALVGRWEPDASAPLSDLCWVGSCYLSDGTRSKSFSPEQFPR